MSVDDLKLKGNEAYKAKDYEAAVQWYTKALDINPKSEESASVYSNRAACWQSMNNYSKALEDAEQCIIVKPSWVKGHYRKALALQSMSKYDEALKAFQDALKNDPGNQEIQERVQDVNNTIRERDNKADPATCKSSDEAKRIGGSLFAAGKYDRAALFYSRAIELSTESNKDLAIYYANRAACYQQRHDYQLVISDCDKAIEIDPSNVKAIIRRAIAYEGIEKWSKALSDYNQANQLSPGMPTVSQGVLRCQRALRG
ncbi:putative stress-inducible protein STI1-like [Trypanosoma theileri]|uniref:Putative stress-inducible protein STI1-like n=1 Tax=Trypanosoma theileri TaxID=67003 RepID=A0A1X0P8F0_9TRYP|nr:putative stress-inducible protein STI1-like [Trypanosoma theileri]ORC93214.1 putative stress-inducible protein STI1-like [Trypanosoma theileri]